MKRPALLSTLMLLSTLGARAPAEMCTLDAVPAATLLLPYFEVDISDSDGDGDPDPGGANTVFSIHNSLPRPALAHVILWTDWSFPTLDFDVFLTGYDVVHVDLFRAIALGSLPVTADEQNDPDDAVSPHHGNPEWDETFPGCAGFFPYPDPIVTAALRDRIQNGHAGYPVPGLDGCVGEALNGAGSCSDDSCPPGTIARGYVTVDSVNTCSACFPNEPCGYFEGIVNNTNQLWGDFFFVNPGGQHPVATSPLVHVEADDAFDASSTATNYTFYGRFTQGLGGVDNREPLGNVWAVRYVNSFQHGTDLVVWRDSTAGGLLGYQGYPCGTGEGAGPDWRPLRETQVVCFDDTEDLVEICSATAGPACFPLETQRLRVGGGELPLPFPSGWCHLNLNIADDAPTDDVDFPADPPGPIAQSWVGALHTSFGLVTAGVRGIELATACRDLDPVIERPPGAGAHPQRPLEARGGDLQRRNER